jgi:alanyl-tRNA synthetase
VQRTGQIGFFKIVSESAVASGVRRIEAVTSVAAEQYILSELAELQHIRQLLSTKTPLKAVQGLQDEQKKLRRDMEQLVEKQAAGLQTQLATQFVERSGYRLLVARIDLDDAKAVKSLAYNLEKQAQPAVLVLGSVSGDKPQLTIVISEQLVAAHGFHAGNTIRQLAAHIRGGGGGQAFFATAGGSLADGLDAALEAARQLF